MFSNIVIATDGSDHALNALKVGIDLAAKYGAKLTLVHVLTHDHPPAEMKRMIAVEHLPDPISNYGNETTGFSAALGRMVGGDGREANEARVIVALGEQILKSAKKKANLGGVKNIGTEIRAGDYANCIIDVAENSNADMIIMGRRGLSKLKGFVTGSVSHKVSQRASCSVLTVK